MSLFAFILSTAKPFTQAGWGDRITNNLYKITLKLMFNITIDMHYDIACFYYNLTGHIDIISML
jgi:hypothetical protein